MIVYVAERGEHCEGSVVLGVFKSKKKAIRLALGQKAHGGPWIADPVDSLKWWSRTDYVEVTRFKVE